MKFIIWDSKDGNPRTPEGSWVSGGLLGELTAENVYLRVYARRPEVSQPFEALAVGECVRNVEFTLSAAKGTYDVYRTE
jgi:hypothetical protein